MKTTSIINAIGVVSIILGVSLGFLPKEQPAPIEVPSMAISYERECLMESIWHEGRGVSYKEKQMIAEVIINRTQHKNYPSTICEVVKQPRQFSYRNSFKVNARLLPEFQSMSVKDQQAYLEIESIADSKLNSSTNVPKVLPNNALHYHAKYVSPSWSKDKKFKVVVVDKKIKHKYYASLE